MKRPGIFIILFIICLFPLKASAEEALTWQDCVKEAAKNHPDLISAQEVVKQNQADKSIAASQKDLHRRGSRPAPGRGG